VKRCWSHGEVLKARFPRLSTYILTLPPTYTKEHLQFLLPQTKSTSGDLSKNITTFPKMPKTDAEQTALNNPETDTRIPEWVNEKESEWTMLRPVIESAINKFPKIGTMSDSKLNEVNKEETEKSLDDLIEKMKRFDHLTRKLTEYHTRNGSSDINYQSVYDRLLSTFIYNALGPEGQEMMRLWMPQNLQKRP
jgi:hypothetical protein